MYVVYISVIYICIFLHFTSLRFYRDFRPPILTSKYCWYHTLEFYVCVPFGEIVAHTDEGLLRAEGFNCDRRTSDFLRSLDPHIDAVLRRRGSFHRVRRKSVFFFFFAVPPLRVERSSFCSRRRPRDPMPRGHVSISFSFFVPFFISCTRPLFVCFSLVPSFPSL